MGTHIFATGVGQALLNQVNSHEPEYVLANTFSPAGAPVGRMVEKGESSVFAHILEPKAKFPLFTQAIHHNFSFNTVRFIDPKMSI